MLGPDEPPASSIVVTEGIINGQVESFSRTWLHPPTPQELDALIREYVREEVYYREGLALGLDRDDAAPSEWRRSGSYARIALDPVAY